MSVAAISQAIESKHHKDLVVFECKNGPTHYATRLLKMDAWVMPRSWAHPSIIAYEIKVTRADFLRDVKWRGYLECCNIFYFAAVKGIIQPDELPPEAGLMELVGTRLVTRKKAQHREQKIDEDVWRYVLMCRVKICKEDEIDRRIDRLRELVRLRQEGKELGWFVSGKLKETTMALEHANRLAEYNKRDIEHLRKSLAELQASGRVTLDVGVVRELNRIKNAVAAIEETCRQETR